MCKLSYFAMQPNLFFSCVFYVVCVLHNFIINAKVQTPQSVSLAIALLLFERSIVGWITPLLLEHSIAFWWELGSGH